MMLNNEEIVRELYAAAEGSGKDIAKIVSFFSDEGYMCDIPSGMKFYGQAIGDCIDTFASAFPDVHRELFDIYVPENVVLHSLSHNDVGLGASATNRIGINWHLDSENCAI